MHLFLGIGVCQLLKKIRAKGGVFYGLKNDNNPALYLRSGIIRMVLYIYIKINGFSGFPTAR